MSEQIIPIEPHVTTVVVHAHKHASLVCHDKPAILITGRGATGTTVKDLPEENSLHLEMFKEGVIHVPAEIQVVLQAIGGHCNINALPQGVAGDHIRGHFTVQKSGPVQVRHVSGHAKVRHVTGNLHLDHVGGHLKAGPCTGNVSTQHVGGHAELVEVLNGCHLPKVGGHAKLIQVGGEQRVGAGGHVRTRIGDPRPDLSYDLTAGGMLTCDLPSTANATIHMQGPAVGPHFNPTRTMGDGAAQIRLQAGGIITLTEDKFTGKGDNLKQGIRETVRAAKAMAQTKAQAVLNENNITPETTADLKEQFTEIAEEAVEVFKEISEEVQGKAKKTWEQGMVTRVTPRDTAPPSRAGQEAARATADEERKMILRMLAENKISVNEANDLLRALNA